MPTMSKEYRAKLVRDLGPEWAKAVEDEWETAVKQMESLGVSYRCAPGSPCDSLGVGLKENGELIGRPLGGATSFSQADEYVKAQEVQGQVLDVVSMFQMISSNALTDEELEPEKRAKLVEAAASEFSTRLSGLSTSEKALLEVKLETAAKSLGILRPPGTKADPANRPKAQDLVFGTAPRVEDPQPAASPASLHVSDFLGMLQKPAVQGEKAGFVYDPSQSWQPKPKKEEEIEDWRPGADYIRDLAERGAVQA